MKINIITQPLFCNYGGILQNYALQEVLRGMDHEVLTVNVPPRKIAPHPGWKDYAHAVINLGKRIRGQYDCPFLNPHTFAKKERELSQPQREFVRKYINKVDCKSPFTKETVSDHPADLWIVGSDQVWRPGARQILKIFSLIFSMTRLPELPTLHLSAPTAGRFQKNRLRE